MKLRHGRLLGGCVLVAALLGFGIALAEDLRTAVLFGGDKIPDASQIEEALFPREIGEQNSDCRKLEEKGLQCGPIIPRASLETTLVTFNRGSASLSEKSRLFLDRVGAVLKNRKDSFVKVVVEGHTDATGTEELNRVLSRKRAESVKGYLGTHYGITNVETVGRASERPRDKSNPSAAINRRIEFVVSLPGQ